MALYRIQTHLAFTDETGAPISGGTLEVYIAGTSTHAVCYRDPLGQATHPFPIHLDNLGSCDFFVDGASKYKYVCKKENGVILETRDNIELGGGSGVTEVAHDETLIGKGTTASPLGADTSVIATRTYVNGVASTYGIEMRPEGANVLRFYRPQTWNIV